ncbi:hypothetical protein BDZ45DRAFT_371362 [Acephala macrosclerotiorum]|nr:hypothetical protein BDZ45DRAFT_371362 [Acephala macrosclerotiorum]
MDSPLPPRSHSRDHLLATPTDTDEKVTCPACSEVFNSYHEFNVHFDDIHLSPEEELEMARRSRRLIIREDSTSPFADGTPATTDPFSVAAPVEGRVSRDECHQGPWGCILCPKSFTRYYTLKEHVRDVHDGPPPRLAACQFRGCRFTFTVKGNYEEHWWNTHRSQGQSMPAPRASIPVVPVLPAARHSSRIRAQRFPDSYGSPPDLKCPHEGCNFVHWQEDAVREHWQVSRILVHTSHLIPSPLLVSALYTFAFPI